MASASLHGRALSRRFRAVVRPNVNVRLRSLHEDEGEDLFGLNPDDLDSLGRTVRWANVVSVLVRPGLWRTEDQVERWLYPGYRFCEWDDFLNVLRQCNSIVTLDFGCDSQDDPNIGIDQIERLIDVLPELPNLRNLYLFNHNIEEGIEELCNVLPRCTSLSHLDLSGNNLDAEAMEDVMYHAMQRCRHIKELILENNNQSLDDTMAIPASNLSLTRLSLNHTDLSPEGGEMGSETGWLAGVLHHCPSLTSLGLRHTVCDFDTDDMETVSAGLSSCTRLTSLDIGSNNLRFHGTMESLVGVLPDLPLLEYLNIENNALDRRDFVTLNDVLRRCTSLTSLNIGGKTPGGEYSNLFAQFVDNGSRSPLKVLNLRDTGLINHIEPFRLVLPALTSLERLDVSRNYLRHDLLDESKTPAQRDNLEIIY